MDNKEFGKQLEKRTNEFAVSIIKLSASLPNSTESKVIKNQITKSGTSVGANYREANRARSRANFKNKICESEAIEAHYWLELIEEFNWSNAEQVKSILNEANKILAIFTSKAAKLNSSHS